MTRLTVEYLAARILELEQEIADLRARSPKEPVEKLFTTAEVCKLLGVHENTVYRWKADGKIGYYEELGKFGASHLQEFLKKQEKRPLTS